MSQLGRPTIPALEFMTRAQAVEKSEIIKPPTILMAECLVAGARIARRGTHKVSRRFKKDGKLPAKYCGVINSTVCGWHRGDTRTVNPSPVGKPIKADQERITRKCRDR